MSSSSTAYKLSMSGDVEIKNRVISEDIARQIINLVLGGTLGVASNNISGLPQVGMGEVSVPSTGSLSAKAFMVQKKPSSETERITCLAYYLYKHRGVNAFKTKDISKVNTEAAQSPFSNAAVFARNAAQAGYLAKAGGGAKQITALGEAVVEALPDREKVKAAIDAHKSPSKRRKKRKAKNAKIKS